MSKKPPNPYRQVAVERPADPKKPWKPREAPRVSKGDMAICSHTPLFYSIPSPCRVEQVEPDSGMMSGWAVLVLDSGGERRWLDGWHFRRA